MGRVSAGRIGLILAAVRLLRVPSRSFSGEHRILALGIDALDEK